MRNLKKNWIQFYSKVLSAAIALLGVVSCSHSKRMIDSPVVMYGGPTMIDVPPVDTIKTPPKDMDQYKLMYGVTPVRYEKNPTIEQDGTDIQIKK
ncbi:MAG: hypothetical protein IJP82_05060 [Bacteroidaceae bacterium]|nr:hypothetical protein [Bacteroidaceae bacterium]